MCLMLFLSCLMAGDGQYGATLNDNVAEIKLTQLMAAPEAYLDKVVQVRGEVKEVCPAKGCWMDVSAENQQVRIKVKDGEIVFDQELVGQQVLVQGTVYKFEMSPDQAKKYFAHLAEEKGEAFDPDTVTEGTTIYQIGGIGAKVLP